MNLMSQSRLKVSMLATPGTEPITKTQELRLVDWREECDHRSLNNFVAPE
jgi:hypothetical protein